MSRDSIGGPLGMAELAALAGCDDASRLHRPQTRDEMRCAAVELAQRGLTPRDIAQALELPEAVVRALLRAAG